jgi:predicted transcriptional regulator
MGQLTKAQMLKRERERLRKLSHLELYDEYCYSSPAELIEDILEKYEEELDGNEIVSCSDCGRDCTPGEDAEGYEDEWTCEDCSDGIVDHDD